MARKTEVVRTSDKSGAKIADGTGGTVRIRLADDTVYRADVTSAEARALLKELNAEKVGGKRAAKKAEREAAAAEADAAEASDDDAADGAVDDVEMTPPQPSEAPETQAA